MELLNYKKNYNCLFKILWEHIMLVTTRDPNPNHPFTTAATAARSKG